MKNKQLYNNMSGWLHASVFGMMLASSVCVQAQDSVATTKDKKPVAKEYAMTEVSGVVKDAATQQPMAGVRVQAYNNALYTAMTDENGAYTIKVPTFVTSLYFNVDGYNAVQRGLGGDSKGVDVSLFSSDFASQYKKNTQATTSATADKFGLCSEMSIDHDMQNQLGADVRALTRSGQPGMGVNMFIQGLNSLELNAQPLLVVDGVIMDVKKDLSIVHDGAFNNILANINPEDIDKVEVLKNGTAIYGAKGANGVLLITTKRNRSMATKIDVKLFGGFELMPSQSDMMKSSDYRRYASDLLPSTSTTLTNFKFLQNDPNYYYYNQYHNETDWKDEVYHTAFTENFGINVQGGDEIANYNLSVGYAQAQSTLKENDFDRFNLRLNSDINLIDKLTTRFDASFSDVNRKLRDDGVKSDINTGIVTAPGFLSLIKSPFLSPYAYDTNGNQSSFLAGADDYLKEVLTKNYSLANPSSILKYGDAINKNSFTNRLINLAITPKYQFNKNWFVSEQFAFSLINTNEEYYLPVNGTPTFENETQQTVTNVGYSLSCRQSSFYSDTKVDWNKQLGPSFVHAQGGFRFMNSSYNMTNMKGFDSGNDKTPNKTDAWTGKEITGGNESWRSLTYYLTGDYNYREKYYVNAGVSMEANSRFGKDGGDLNMFGVAWGLFPSVQAAWVMSNEPWFKAGNAINYLKWNVGFDITGNDNINNAASRSYLTSHGILLNGYSVGATGLSISNIGNTKLQWESTKRLTAGVEMNLLNNRLSFSADFFKSWTSNLVTLKALSWISGLDYNWSNDGKLENIGISAKANVKIINHKDWKWDLGASVAHYKNEITALPGNKDFNTEIYGATVRSQVGSPVGVFYGFKTNGVYATTAQAEADGHYIYNADNGQKTYFGAGDMRFVDTDGNNCIDDKDRVVIGDPNPDIYGNIFTNLHYKRLALNVVFNYSLGNDVFNYQRSLLECGSRFYNQTTAMNARWTMEGQVTDIPRVTYGDPMGNARFSDRWIEDGSYLRLKNVTLSYTLPINATYIQGITVWASASNLLTFTKYLGSDPEFSLGENALMQGIDRGIVSQGRTFVLGAKINL